MSRASLWRRLKAIARRRRLDRDLRDELAFHLAMREADYIAAGMAPAAARAAAARAFGNATHVREETRDMWRFTALESIAQDARYALRGLRRSPAFALVAIAVLALGIGGNTAIFSLVDAVRVQALPYPEPDRLVELWGNVMRAKLERRGASYPDFLDWRAQSKSFDAMAAFDQQMVTLAGDDDPERVSGEFVSAPYFALLGLSPARGRTFRADEDDVAKPAPVVVISDGLWRRRFGADPQIVGRQLAIRGQLFSTYTVIGVMPPRVLGLSDAAELWLPFAQYASPSEMANRGNRGFAALARLAPGVSTAAAQAELDGISHRLAAAYPDSNANRGVEVSPLDAELFGTLRPALLTLMAAVVFVLLIACSNVANLLLARSEARRREIAVRVALGAGRGRLLRQLVTEGCVLTFLGAAIGLALARALVAALVAHSPIAFPSFLALGLDARVAMFTIALSVVCGVLVGLTPALQTRIGALGDALKEAARVSGGRRSQHLRGALIVAEVSLAVVLLVGAGLMIRSARNLAALEPGFKPDRVLTMHDSIPRAPADANRPAGASVNGRALLERVRAVPGVASAALGTDLPLEGNSSAAYYSAEGQAVVNAQTIPRTYIHRVSPGFFAALGVAIKSGRDFTDDDAKAPSTAVIVSERVQRRFWPREGALGKRVKFGPITSDNPWMTIVGVVGEMKYRGLPDNPTADPDIYLPFLDRNSQIALVLRTTAAPASLVSTVRAAIRGLDRTIAVYGVAPMDELVSAQTAQSRFTTWLMGVFAAAALLLAAIGIYGVMSYLVTQRTREIGIRLALGATPASVRRMIVGRGARLIGVGIAIGVAASFALVRFVSALLFGVDASDAATIVAVASLAIVALLACYVPAVRATRIDPLMALRYE